MAKTAIVVGAGILGLATARALALKGYNVNVYDRSLMVSGASVRNFGMVWPIGQPAGKLYNRAIASRNCWSEIGKSSDLWFDQTGSLHLAYNNEEWQVLKEVYEVFRNEGRNVELLNKEQVLKKSSIAKAENCKGGLYSYEEIIVDPREAIALLPRYLGEKLNIQFHWGKAVTAVRTGTIQCGQESVRADQIFICSGSDFETLYPEEYLKYPLTKCKLQMMRLIESGTPRIGPAICGGLSLIHYHSFKAADSLDKLKKFYKENLPEYLTWGIHVMVSQNHLGHLTVGDSHEYGLSPDPFDKKHINDLILDYLSKFTALREPKIIETWNGVYAKFTNDQTELFFSPDPEVYIINGVGGNGMTMSFGLAEELIGAL